MILINQEKDAIMALKKSKICCRCIFVECICMSAHTAPSLVCWDRTGKYENGDVQASGTKRENAHLAVRYYENYSCPSRQVMHNNFEVVRGLRSNYKYIHCCTHYVHSVQSVTPRVKIMILTSVICWLFSDFYWVDLCTHTARPVSYTHLTLPTIYSV